MGDGNARTLAALILFVAGPGATAVAEEVALFGDFGLTSDPAQDAAAEPGAEPGSDGWWAEIDLSLWLPGISGTVGARGVTADVNLSFADVFGDADSVIGVAGAGLFGKGRLGGYVDGFWSQIGFDAVTTMGTADIRTDMGILDFGVSYEIGRWPLEFTAKAGEPARDLVLVGYVGGRYTSLETKLSPALMPSISESTGWVDPMLGGRLFVPVSPHWSFGFRGDIGGFGVSSDLAWTAIGVVSWDFHVKEMPSSLQFGYVAIGDDYSTGIGASRFVWDTILHGFVLNFGMRF